MFNAHAREKVERVVFGIIIVSTSRYEALARGKQIEDRTGELLRKRIEKLGWRVKEKKIVPDDVEAIKQAVLEIVKEVDAVIVSGGSGVARSDVTVEALKPLFEKEMPGFGELFRMLSYQYIGGNAMLSRATAGVIGQAAVFITPGSPDGALLAFDQIISHCIQHLVYLLRKER